MYSDHTQNRLLTGANAAFMATRASTVVANDVCDLSTISPYLRRPALTESEARAERAGPSNDQPTPPSAA